MKYILISLLLFPLFGALAQADKKEKIDELIEEWHDAASRADFEAYFEKMSPQAIFIGTDPTEYWEKEEFRVWAKPYFDRGQAWDFTSLERNIFLAEDCEIAWFDELLETQMGICRGSGIVAKEKGEWKIKHYVLSIAVPNENVGELTLLKEEFDQELISELKEK